MHSDIRIVIFILMRAKVFSYERAAEEALVAINFKVG